MATTVTTASAAEVKKERQSEIVQQRNKERKKRRFHSKGTTSGHTEIGYDICACSPSEYEMTFDFSRSCHTRYTTTADNDHHKISYGYGIREGSCLITGFGPAISQNINSSSSSDGNNTTVQNDSDDDYFVPVSVLDIQFIEVGSRGTPIWVQQEIGNFVNGSTVNYTSIVSSVSKSPFDKSKFLLDKKYATDTIPQTFQGRAMGTNRNGDVLLLQFALNYNNDCHNFPLLQEGESIGWIVFNRLKNPEEILCPLAEFSPREQEIAIVGVGDQ